MEDSEHDLILIWTQNIGGQYLVSKNDYLQYLKNKGSATISFYHIESKKTYIQRYEYDSAFPIDAFIREEICFKRI